MKRRHLITGGLIVAASPFALSALVQAHNAQASATCEGGVVWSATQYEAAQTNSIVVTIDGATVYSDTNFGTTDQGSKPNPDKTVSHSWSVVVNAPGTQFDFNLGGTIPVCQQPTTTLPETTTSSSSPAPTTTICEDCTPETVVTVPPTTGPTPSTSGPAPTTTLSPSTTVTTCIDPVTHQQTVDHTRCIPVTGSGAGRLAILAGFVLAIGAAIFFARGWRPGWNE